MASWHELLRILNLLIQEAKFITEVTTTEGNKKIQILSVKPFWLLRNQIFKYQFSAQDTNI